MILKSEEVRELRAQLTALRGQEVQDAEQAARHAQRVVELEAQLRAKNEEKAALLEKVASQSDMQGICMRCSLVHLWSCALVVKKTNCEQQVRVRRVAECMQATQGSSHHAPPLCTI